MTNESFGDLWDSFLKVAVIKNALSEADSFSLENDFNKTDIPAHYDSQIRVLIKKHYIKDTLKSILRLSKKTILALITIMGLGFLILLQFKEVRTACQNVVTHFYETHIQFEFSTNSTPSAKTITVNYIPENFSLIDSYSNERETYLYYTDSTENVITISCYTQNRTQQIDNEHYTINNIKVNQYNGTLFISDDSKFLNHIIWNTKSKYFSISSSLDEETIIKIAKSIK